MSNVWETRCRLLVEQLEQWVDWLSDTEPIEPAAVEELTVRLLVGNVKLLKQHAVNKRGQCKFCGWTRWRWRFWRRRRRCTVCQALDRAMNEGLDVVWWELFTATGRERSLGEVREWLSARSTA